MISRPLRIIWKCFKWSFLLTLPFAPITALPTILGILNGIYFAVWQDARVSSNTDTWLYELKDIANDWGLPEMTFRDFQDKENEFHVLRLNSNDWASKLGFLHPQEYAKDTDIPINKYGDLDTLMVDTTSSCRAPNEQWVYISEFAWPSINEWDAAFDAAVQAAYIPSALNETRIFFAKCQDTAGFLCGVWGVKAPALMHFSVVDSAPLPDDISFGLTYSTSTSNLRVVTARVIEFPLKDSYTGLPSSVFPGPEEQMLAMMRGDKLWEQFDPWNDFVQSWLRFHEYIDKKFYDRKGTILCYLGDAEEWIVDHFEKPLGLESTDGIVYSITFLATTTLVNIFILGPWHAIRQTFLDFLGYPRRGEIILGDDFEKEWNPWDDLMGMPNALSQVLDKVLKEAEQGKDYSEDKITTTSRLRTALSSESSGTADFKW